MDGRGYSPCDSGEKLPESPVEDPSTKPKKSFWQRRSPLEKKLLILVIVAVLLLFIILLILLPIALSPRRDNVCLTAGCVKVASRIIQGMNKDASPCQDFFEYACGQWNRKHRIPDGLSRTTSFGLLRQEVKGVVRDSLEEPELPHEPKSVKKAKGLYKECINQTQAEVRGVSALMNFISELGGWPSISSDWKESDFDFVGQMISTKKLASDVFFWVWVNIDDKHSDTYITTIGASGLAIGSRDYYLNGRDDAVLKAYEEYAKDLTILLGADPKIAKKDIEDIIDLEIEIAKILTPKEEQRDFEALYNKMSLKILKEKYQEFDWGRYMKEVYAYVNITLNDTDSIIVRNPKYLTDVFRLIKRTPKRTIANYIVWRHVGRYIADLPEKHRNTRKQYKQARFGSSSERDRWIVCVEWVASKLGGAIGRIFVEKKFNQDSKIEAEKMIANIQAAFDDILEETEWMDDITRIAAKEKAAGLRPRVAYPDFIMNDTALDEKYKEVVVLPNKFFENVVALQRVRSKANLLRILRPVDNIKWASVYPATVNAYYYPNSNQIMFPAGILQPPYFHTEYPRYLNYGGIGMMMGHEITHGFDDEGRQTDKDGNLVAWWQPSAVKNFEEKAQCIINQYSSYFVKEVNMTLNGINTQGENIADNGGIKESFRAYRKYIAKRGEEEPTLPGLDLTSNQLFFINFAQIRCSRDRPASLRNAITSWRHSPNRYRVIGSVSNMPEFSEAFNCPAGSPMNPEKKCKVW